MEPICNCQKPEKGTVPLFLARTSVALKEHALPDLPSNFVTDYPLEGDIQYTSRILRSGYLYIYEETNSDWLDYYVTNKGFYYLLPSNINSSSFENALDNTNFSCQHDADASGMASFISLKADKQNRYYLIWSPVRWTDKTREQFNDSSFRQQHMQYFDAGNWYNQVSRSAVGITPENSILINQLAEVVAEYSWNTQGKGQILSRYTSPLSPWIARDDSFKEMVLRAADRQLDNGGLIFNLSDSSGMAADIAAIMKSVTEDKIYNNTENEFNRNLFLHNSINAIVENAKQASVIMSDNESWVQNPYHGWSTSLTAPEVLNNRYDAIEREAEQRYLSHIDQSARQQFLTEYQQIVTQLKATILTPLAELHVLLMDSRKLKNQFIVLFDNSEKGFYQQGISFVVLFLACIKDTQEQPACTMMQERWLTAENSLLQKALAFNYDELDKRLQNYAEREGQIDIDFEKVTELVDKGVSEGHLFLLGQLFNELSRALTNRVVNGLADNNSRINPVLLKFSGLAKQRLITIRTEGNINQLLKLSKEITSHYLQVSGNDSHRLYKALARRYDYLQLRGANQTGNKMATGFTVILDTQNFNKISDVSKNIMTESQRNKLIEEAYYQSLTKGLSVLVKSIHVFLQATGLVALSQKIGESDKYAKQFLLGSVGLILIPTTWGVEKFILPRIASAMMKKWITFALKGGSLAVGIGFGAIDIHEGSKHFSINPELSYLEIVSGVMTSAFVIVMSIGSGATFYIGVWLFGVLIIIEYIKAKYEINDIEKWLMRTKWGIVSNKLTLEEQNHIIRFNTLAQEQSALDTITQVE